MDFWSNALPLMNKKGIKRTDVAKATGKTRSAVTDWIKRKVYPTADDAVKIAELLGVSVRYLVTGEDEEGLSPREKELLDVCRLLSCAFALLSLYSSAFPIIDYHIAISLMKNKRPLVSQGLRRK